MFFDVLFLGLPFGVGLCMAGIGYRDEEPKYVMPAICLFAYCIFYLFGGRDVVLYLVTAAIAGQIVMP
jgi:hypothetical protein